MEKQNRLDNSSNRDYWKDVLLEASRLLWGNVWMKAAILAIGIFVLGLVGFGALLSKGIVQFENPFQSILTNSMFQIVEVCLYALIVLFLFATYIYSIPPKKHNEQIEKLSAKGKEITELKENWKSLTTQVRLNVTEHNDLDGKKCGIHIISSTKPKITHLRITLRDATWVKRDGTRMPAVIPLDNRRFPNSSGFQERETMFMGDDVFIYLAEVSADAPMLLLEKKYGYDSAVETWLDTPSLVWFDIATLEIEFEIDGIVDSRPILADEGSLSYKAQIFFERRRWDKILKVESFILMHKLTPMTR